MQQNALLLPSPPAPASAQHQYDTRTRSNSGIKPSARLRQSPDASQPPRRVKAIPGTKSKQAVASAPVAQAVLPPFPPPHVMLHADDAGNKVFLAIGRALVSAVSSFHVIVRAQVIEICHGYEFRTTAP